MTRFYDGKKIVEIGMCIWQDTQYSPDFSGDYFQCGGLEYNSELDAYKVDDIDFLVDAATEWEDEDENNATFIDYPDDIIE